jgi:hypothetical protein
MSDRAPSRTALVRALALFLVMTGLLGFLFSLGALWYANVPDDEGQSLHTIGVGSAISAAAAFVLGYFAQRRPGESPGARGFDVVVQGEPIQEDSRQRE